MNFRSVVELRKNNNVVNADVEYIFQVNLYLFRERKKQTFFKTRFTIINLNQRKFALPLGKTSLDHAILKEHEKNWKHSFHEIYWHRQIKIRTQQQGCKSQQQNNLSFSLAQKLKIKRASNSTPHLIPAGRRMSILTSSFGVTRIRANRHPP